MITFISFVFVLGVLVFVHELGHFLVAKRAGIRVERFSLGFPPKAFGVTVGETEYCISWLPVGGYVKVAGMDDFGNGAPQGRPWEFQSKPIWVKMGVMAAGPFMNFLLGFLIILAVRVGAGEYAFLNSTRIGRLTAESPLKTADVRPGDRIISVSGREVEDWAELSQALADARGKQAVLEVLREERSFVVSVSVDADATSLGIDPFIPSTAGSVLSGRPAETAGLLPGDRIVSVDGVPVAQWWEMSQRISARPEQEIEIRWLRDGVEYAIQITPGAEEVQGKTVGRIGIGMSRTPVGFGKAVLGSGNEMLRFTTAIFLFIKQLLSGEASGRALAGPVMIAQMAGESARQGWEALLSFMALLSVNLAILNLLPIPMLDGGHLMILTVEAAMRRPLSARHKEVLQRAGFAFLLFVMLYVTLGDITRIFGWFNQ